MRNERKYLKFGYGYNEKIKDLPYYKSTDENGKTSKCYCMWFNMMKRCYDTEFISSRNPTYEGCRVCKKWHNFQRFAQWYEENYYEVENTMMSIDKDILVDNNKVYSPSTCCIIPIGLNNVFKPNVRISRAEKIKMFNKYKEYLPSKVRNRIVKLLNIK